MNIEIWKRFKYNYYVSNTGKVKHKSIIRKVGFVGSGTTSHLNVNIYVGNQQIENYRVVNLVYTLFVGEIPKGYVIRCIDGNKFNTSLENLELITLRKQTADAYLKTGKKTSLYTGVYYDKARDKWCARLYSNGKTKHLGRHDFEIDARDAYVNELLKIA